MRLYRWSKLGGNRKIYNLTLSNVPGPQEQCYLMGATVRARYAFGPVFYGAGLNITVMSLNGSLDVGLVSCSDLLPMGPGRRSAPRTQGAAGRGELTRVQPGSCRESGRPQFNSLPRAPW